MRRESDGCLAGIGVTLVLAAIAVGLGRIYGASIGWVAFLAMAGGWALLAAAGGDDGRDG